MAFESGGRADKLGNYYETNWLIEQYCDLLEEKIRFVMSEAVGQMEEGTDIWIADSEGNKTCFQCKARNGSKPAWSIADLNSEGILTNMKRQLERDSTATFKLVSAVSCIQLSDLCLRAKNSSVDGTEFYEQQVKTSGKKVNDDFFRFCSAFDLDIATETDLNKAIGYLKRIDTVHFADDSFSKSIILNRLQIMFSENPNLIYSLLSSYLLQNNRMGQEISGHELISFLQTKNIHLRVRYAPEQILPKIFEINDRFKNSMSLINNCYFEREETKECIQQFEEEHCLIIHGAAGIGKSGCIHGLMTYLNDQSIPYIAVKLDKYIPENTSDQFGKSVGLPYSPAIILDEISQNTNACLILDQLDAIRWTTRFSSSAFDVCKSILEQVNSLNRNRKKKIVIVLACRTFDYENDANIKNLLLSNGDSQKYKEIMIKPLTDESVKTIIGDSYSQLHVKTKELLRKPGNLFIWSKLSSDSRTLPNRTASSLMDNWWRQILTDCETQGIDTSQIKALKNTIVNEMESLGKLHIPQPFDVSPTIISALVSLGLLNINENIISFTHQSFFDNFLTQQAFNEIVLNKSTIISQLPEYKKQSPAKRFRLQLLLDRLLEYDMDIFLQQGLLLLKEENVRYYFKYVFLEVLSTYAGNIADAVKFTDALLALDDWKTHFINDVVFYHGLFTEVFIYKGIIGEWLGSEDMRGKALHYLRVVANQIPDKITSFIKEKYKQQELNEEDIYYILPFDIEEDSESMFELRLQIVRNNPQIIKNNLYIEHLLKHNPKRAVKLLAMLLTIEIELDDNELDVNIYCKDILINLDKSDAEYVLKELLPIIETLTTQNLENRFLHYDWRSVEYGNNKLKRFCTDFSKAAVLVLAQAEPNRFISILKPYWGSQSEVLREVILSGLELLPADFSNDAINYLLLNAGNNCIEHTSNEKYSISIAQRVIEKFTCICDEDMFVKLEEMLLNYQEDTLDSAKFYIRHNIEVLKKETDDEYFYYYPVYGYLQKALLPSLCKNRRSKQTEDLISALERNDKISINHYQNSNGHSGWVKSVIANKIDFISDRQWLKIVRSSTNDRKRKLDKWVETEGGFYSSDIGDLCNSLRTAGSSDPVRFVKLALKFPENVQSIFISAALSWIQYTEDKVDSGKVVSLELAETLIRRFESFLNTDHVAIELCRAIEERASENVPEYIIEKILSIAQKHSDPLEGNFKTMPIKDEEHEPDLLIESLNCVRGVAGHAVYKLLINHPDLYVAIKETIECFVNDPHPAVQTVAVYCISAIYNNDTQFLQEQYIKLVQRTPKLLVLHNTWQLLLHIFRNNTAAKNPIINGLRLLLGSSNKTLVRSAAVNLTALYIFEGLNELNDIYSAPDSWTEEQKDGIVKQVVYCFSIDVHKQESKKLLEKIIDSDIDIKNTSIFRLFRDGIVSLPEDKEFVKKLLRSGVSSHIMHSFLEFISTNDVNIKDFKDILMDACLNADKNKEAKSIDLGYRMDNLVRAIILLMDRAQDDEEVYCACLDMWDMLFRKGIGHTRSLTKALNEI